MSEPSRYCCYYTKSIDERLVEEYDKRYKFYYSEKQAKSFTKKRFGKVNRIHGKVYTLCVQEGDTDVSKWDDLVLVGEGTMKDMTHGPDNWGTNVK
jgi:hypothetical protein